MPELPEVETIARELRRSVVGAAITHAHVHWPRSIAAPNPWAFARDVSGRQITAVSRRGKWIVVVLDEGKTLLVHLRMTGRLLVTNGACPDAGYVRVRFLLDDGRSICFHDVRKFGRLHLVDEPEAVLGALGPEPLASGFTLDEFRRLLRGRRGRIKPLLLNQRFVAGLGNIYTDEALWRARIHPLRKANHLSRNEITRLWAAIRDVLARAIESGGTTLDDGGFVGAGGDPGEFAPHLAVYGREGDRCPACDAEIERMVVCQRGTHVCPGCQEMR